jgi:hypothetical protein
MLEYLHDSNFIKYTELFPNLFEQEQGPEH